MKRKTSRREFFGVTAGFAASTACGLAVLADPASAAAEFLSLIRFAIAALNP